MNDLDLKKILDHKDKTINMQRETIWHKDRTIEKQKGIIEDLKEAIKLMEDKINLLHLENTILQSQLFYKEEKGKVCGNQLQMKL